MYLNPWNQTNNGQHFYLIIKDYDWLGRADLGRDFAYQSQKIIDWRKLAFSVKYRSSKLDCTLNWPLSFSPSLSLTTFMECFWRNGMSENCGRWLGIYKDGMPMRSGHTSDCVSARMLLVACAATHGRLHVVMHVSLTSTCLSACTDFMRCDTSLPCMSARMCRLQIRLHLVLWNVMLICTATCCASVDTQLVR